jgi:hypothetical protein
VALIPLSNQDDAEKAIVRARDSQQRHEKSQDETAGDASDDDQTMSLADDASVQDPDPESPPGENSVPYDKGNASNVTEDVIMKKGMYGRFTEKWFSNKGWSTGSRRSQGLSEEELKVLQEPSVNASTSEQTAVSNQEVTASEKELEIPEEKAVPAEVAHVLEPESNTAQIPLLPKLLTTTKLFFGSKNFFFSYDYDLSRSVSKQIQDPSSASLHKSFDPLVSLMFGH